MCQTTVQRFNDKKYIFYTLESRDELLKRLKMTWNLEMGRNSGLWKRG